MIGLFGAALGLAVSPIMVIHSHYLKEDMIFTFFSILTLISLVKFYRSPKISLAVYLGIASGLALSSQYKGALLFVLILVSPLFAVETDRRSFFTKIPVVLFTAALVFFAVNYPIFINPESFMKGLSYETGHVLRGHTAQISPLSHYFTFHLVHSIVPGIKWPFTVLGIIGLILIIIKWKHVGILERLFAAYFLLFYFFQEAVPLKPFPGFIRYMIPIIPAMFFFTGFLLRALISRFKTPVVGTVTAAMIGLLIVVSSYDSFLLDYYLKKDTRAQAAALVKKSGEKAIFERYATDEKCGAIWLARVDLKKAKKDGVKLLVASSFNYGRFYFDKKMKGQSPFFYGLRKKYDHLFALPFKEIRPVHRTYAFSNPVIRIIDISEN
ncbi:ArnT family glycosyltransferase [Thermodesulfobacteriota bacterium]